MNIVITGSLGNISRPLTENLVARGHTVTVISSSSERRSAITDLGATAAIGTMDDATFLTMTFTGAEAVYCMETFDFFDAELDYLSYVEGIARSYRQAITAAGVQKVIHLSSIGAHTDQGVGILKFHHRAEQILRELPTSVAIKFIRPVGFFTNLYTQIPTIKAQGIMAANFGGDEAEPWVAPADIAEVIAEEFDRPFEGRMVRYVASDEVSGPEIATAIGEAIGKSDLQWVTVSDDELLTGLLEAGMNPQIARDYMAMQAAQRDGSIYVDFNAHRPVFRKIKLADFAEQFAAAYR